MVRIMVININRIVTLHVSRDMYELLLVTLDGKKYVGVFHMSKN